MNPYGKEISKKRMQSGPAENCNKKKVGNKSTINECHQNKRLALQLKGKKPDFSPIPHSHWTMRSEREARGRENRRKKPAQCQKDLSSSSSTRQAQERARESAVERGGPHKSSADRPRDVNPLKSPDPVCMMKTAHYRGG